MTNTELKSQIDFDITNKTSPSSISTTNVGDNLKDVVDYVDQEITSVKNLDVTYFDNDSVDPYLHQSEVPTQKSKDTYFRISQSGTTEPNAYNYYIDEIQISPLDNTDPLFRAVLFNYEDVGKYNVQIIWKTGSDSAIDITKIDISSSSKRIEFTTETTGSFGTYSYYQLSFETRNNSGTLANGVLSLTNIYLRLFN